MKTFSQRENECASSEVEPVSDFEFVFAVCIYLCICNLITSCHSSNGHDWVVLVNAKARGKTHSSSSILSRER